MADRRLAKYGVEYVLNFELYDIDGVDLNIGCSDGGSDCSIRKDQAAAGVATNDFVDEGFTYSLTITSTEMQAKEVIVIIIDSATKVYLDKVIVIETYGNASGLHAMDFDDAVRGGMSALPNAAADAAGGVPISDAGGLDLDAKLANTNEITAARMGALTDWINGGRLDLIIDAILTDTGTTLPATLATIAGYLDTEIAAIKAVTDLLPNAGALSDLAAILTDTGTTLPALITTIDTVVDAIKAVTDLLPNAGALSDLAAIKAITDLLTLVAIKGEVINGLDTAIPASPTANSPYDILDRQEESITAGTAQTGTLSTTEMTTNLTVTVADQFNGRILTFRKDTTTAALRGQQTDITATTVANSKLGFTALTTAPVNGDTFEIN